MLTAAMTVGLFVAPVYAEEQATLNLINAPAAINGVFSNTDIYEKYLNTTLTSEHSNATYEWLNNAKSNDTLESNDIVSGVSTGANANLNNGKALWCPSGWNYQVKLEDASLTYTVRFDLKDWYNVSRVDVFEVNYKESDGVTTYGVSDIDVSVGIRTDSMTAVGVTKTSFLGKSDISENHSTGRATTNTFSSAIRGRYVDVTFSVTGGAELQGIMIFGEKPEKHNLKLVSGKALNNSGKYGALDVYPQHLDANIEVLSSAATYTWSEGTPEISDTTKLTDGQVWSPANWVNGVWISIRENNVELEVEKTITFDLGNTFDISRIDIHEASYNQWNHVDAIEISAGSTKDSLAAVSFEKENRTGNIYSTQISRANILTFTPMEARYVQVKVKGYAMYIQEIMVFGDSVEKTDYSVISGNALTDADKEWYASQYKMNVTVLDTDTTYRWAEFGLDDKNTVDIKTAALDDDYNSDGIGGERNIADGSVTSSAAEHIVPVSGKGANAVIYDFGKKMSISRVDVHELVKSGVGIGTITVKYGDKYGAVNSIAKTVTLDASSADELTHRNDIIEFGAPVEARFLAVQFNFTEACGNSYNLGEVIVFGSEPETKSYNTLKSLSGQSWNSGNLKYYQDKGYTAEAIDTGATYEWATGEECAEVTSVPTNLTALTDGGFNATNNVGFANSVSAATFDLKAPRTVNRVDVCYNENIWNGFKSMTVYASNTKSGLYSDANKVGVFDMSGGENKGFYPVVSGTSVIAPYEFDAVEARYVGILLNSTGADTDNDTTLRQVVIFGDDSKFAPLNAAIARAKEYDNAVPYTSATWKALQNAVEDGEATASKDNASDNEISVAAKAIDDAIEKLTLRGGQQIISQNSMSTNEWSVFSGRYSDIKQAELANTSYKFMSRNDGLSDADTNNVDTEASKRSAELFDGGIIMYSGSSAIWSNGYGDSGYGTTYLLYDFGEEVWINGADVATYDYKIYSGESSKFIGELGVEVSNDGVNFTPVGSTKSAEFTDDEIGKAIVHVTSTTFPAKKARYARVSVTKGAGTVQYVLMEMWIRGAKDITNQIMISRDDDNSVSASVALASNADSAKMFIARYAADGSLTGVVSTKQTEIIDGTCELSLESDSELNETVKAMVFDSEETIKPLTDFAAVENHTDTEFTLSSMFKENGVLQRGEKLAIYGTATTGTKITVDVTVNSDKKSYEAAADADGEWIVYADSINANDSVSISASDGNKALDVSNMVGGDVWLLSGQSNMYYTFDLLESRDELPSDTSKYTGFRFYNVPVVDKNEPTKEINGEWVKISELTTEDIADLSAIGILAGIEFSEYLKNEVPVGVILAARGGTSIEGFMSRESFVGVTSRYWNNLDRSKYYNGMIYPIVPYGIKGVLWYQGCQNHANTTDNDYLELEKAWVNDWREKWSDASLPFIITMLAPTSSGNFAHIRDKQLALRDAEDNIGVISIMDLGDTSPSDYGGNIHPKEKKEVARRLVLAAEAIAYGETSVKYRFPVMKSVALKDDGSVDVKFDDVYDGLKVKDGDTTVTGFKLKVGNELKAATATITGKDTVNVKIDGVKKPTAVWYAYQGAINPELNLFNSEDLSAAPFYAELD